MGPQKSIVVKKSIESNQKISYTDTVICSTPNPTQLHLVTTSATGIADYGAINIYNAPDAHPVNTDRTVPRVRVGTANDQVARSAGTAERSILQLVQAFYTTVHIMLSLKHTLIDIGTICDADCTVTFSKRDVTVFAPYNTPILMG